jgi:hypothetical protein
VSSSLTQRTGNKEPCHHRALPNSAGRMMCRHADECEQVAEICQVTILQIVFLFGQPRRMLSPFDFIRDRGAGLV